MIDPEILKYLYGLTNRGIKLGLEPTRQLLQYFGNPHLKIPSIHIAGTNGKGSTAAITQSILQAAGYQTGLYTSPHLLDFRERIRINQQLIGSEEIAHQVSRIKLASEKIGVPVTFFEFTTVMAFLHFFEQKTDINVIEVGLGGRLDATNLCQAEVSLITSLSQDHTAYLGTDILKIAEEKAAIIKESGTVFAHIEEDRVFNRIVKTATDRSARIFRLGKDFQGTRKAFSLKGQNFDFDWHPWHYADLQLGLIGRHQIGNASLAVAACVEMGKKGWDIPEKAVREGLKNARWEGRLEIIGEHPTIVVDCAHNPEGAKKLTQSLREFFSFKRCLLVVGIMKDKPIDEMLAELAGLADHIFLVRPDQERSEDPQELKRGLAPWPVAVDIVERIPDALNVVRAHAGPDDLICITGSIFTVAEAKQTFKNETSFKTTIPHPDTSHPGG